MPHRCAFGCEDNSNVMHSFPNPQKFPERFKAWANLVGNLETLTDYDIYKKKRICDIHFIDEHRNRYKRLNALAMPALYLPGKSNDITATSGQSEASLRHSHPITSIALPSTSTTDKNDSITATTEQFETVGVGHPPTNNSLPAISTSEKSPYFPTIDVTLEHNYGINPQKQLLKDSCVRKAAQFIRLQRPLQKKTKYLQNEICRLRKKVKSLKAQLVNAEKMSHNVAFEMVTKNMTKAAKLFVHMQMQSEKKSKGRRFSNEEKALSLSLFKKSPSCYRMLHKYFVLPSAKVMNHLLSQIKLVPVINQV